MPSVLLSPWTVKNLDKHSERVLIWGLARCLQALVNPWLILLMDGLFSSLKRKRMWMSIALAKTQSKCPRLCQGYQRVLHLGWQESGCESWLSHYSLQPPVPLLFFLPKKESWFPIWLRGGELAGHWSHNWVAWSRPRQGCFLILHQTQASLIGFSSHKASFSPKNWLSFIGK